jgi:hypothetical protein
MHTAARERGQVLPLVALLLVFCLAIAAAIVHLSTTVVARSRATTAADAAALAGAAGGRGAAEAVARANDADLLRFERSGDVVVVEVRRDGHRVTARAEAVVRQAP